MTGIEFLQLVQDGRLPVVEFKSGVEEEESCIDPGMRGRAVSAIFDNDRCLSIRFDLEPFVEFDKQLARPNYYGPDGEANLTVWEAGFYRPFEDIWIDGDGDTAALLEIVSVENLTLYEEYKRSAEAGTSYLRWLEAELLAARTAR